MPIQCQMGCCGHFPVTEEQDCACYRHRTSDGKQLMKELTDPELRTMKKMKKVSQVHPCLDVKMDPCAPAHNQYICHSMGEKRQHYLKQVKRILDKVDEMECPTKTEIEDEKGTGGVPAYERPIIKFPGYADVDCPKFKRAFFAPLLESMEKSKQMTHGDGKHTTNDTQCKAWSLPRKRSFELKGGILFRGCDCSKHNGIQDRCVRSECGGKPKCLTQPEPICLPSQTVVNPPPQRPVDDMVREVVYTRQMGRAAKTYCCCPSSAPKKTSTKKNEEECEEFPPGGKMECYRCNDN